VGELEIYIDGASSGNPGPAGIGVIITKDGRIVKNLSVYLGIQTNNVAEYMSLIFGLQEALIFRADAVKIYTDSQLLCRQINNEYKIKSPNLIGLYSQVKHLLSGFNQAEIKYICRDKNRGADKLARKAVKAN
jgi:ribonuclease HI